MQNRLSAVWIFQQRRPNPMPTVVRSPNDSGFIQREPSDAFRQGNPSRADEHLATHVGKDTYAPIDPNASPMLEGPSPAEAPRAE
jgi:hypothetical protein